MEREQDDYIFDFEKGCFVKKDEIVFDPERIDYLLDNKKEDDIKNNIKKECNIKIK
jgi:hypothetical protein